MLNWIIPTIVVSVCLAAFVAQTKPDFFSNIFHSRNLTGFLFVIGLIFIGVGNTASDEERKSLGLAVRMLMNIGFASGIGLVITSILLFVKRA